VILDGTDLKLGVGSSGNGSKVGCGLMVGGDGHWGKGRFAGLLG